MRSVSGDVTHGDSVGEDKAGIKDKEQQLCKVVYKCRVRLRDSAPFHGEFIAHRIPLEL